MALIFDGEEVVCKCEVRDWHEHEFATTHKSPAHYRRKRINGVPQFNVLVFHWTGGERGHRGIASTLKQRERGIPWTINYTGTIWQYCDPAKVVSPHVGKFNRFAGGVEVQSHGIMRGPKVEAKFQKQAPRELSTWAPGDPKSSALPEKTYVNFTLEQLAACVDLASALADEGIIEPHLVRHKGEWNTRIPKTAWPQCRGVGFHFQFHPTKLDAGPLLAEHFESLGW